jgi:prepilin-type N-terminal cleavage/methylation domain-containing protein/prepilin-type processing-associated H-X9-DG protein
VFPIRCRRMGFTLVELLVVVAIIGVVLSFLIPKVQEAREQARRAQCVNNLKQLGLAAHNYHSSNNCLPIGIILQPDANGSGNLPSQSVFVALSAYMEQPSVYNAWNFDVNIRNAHNYTVSGLRISTLWCPTDSEVSEPKPLPQGAMLDPGSPLMQYASYAGCTGWSFQWPAVGQKGRQIDRTNGVFGFQDPVDFSAITDGTSNTFLIGERFHSSLPQENAAVWWHWWSYGNNGDTLFCTLFPPNTPRKDKSYNRSTDAVAYLSGASSGHDGGCNFAMADGSVRFIKDTINSSPSDPATGLPIGIKFGDGIYPYFLEGAKPGVYQALSSRDGSEVISNNAF